MLDYNTRKELEEAWLYEMAYELKDAKKIITKNGFELKVHLAKCFLFKNTQWYQHWLKECSTFCIVCDDIRVKPKGKRIPAEVFLKDGYICSEIETAADAKGYLNFVISNYQELRIEEATNDEALRFLDLWNSLRVELADYMSDEDIFDRSTYMEVIDKAINEAYDEVK